MVFLNFELMVWRSSDKKLVDLGFGDVDVQDIVYYKNQFHVVMSNGHILSVDPKSLEVSSPLLTRFTYKSFVNTSSELYLIENRNSSDKKFGNKKNFSPAKAEKVVLNSIFYVFELDEEEQERIEVRDLDGRALFLFDGGDLFVSAKEFLGIKPNCVYMGETDSFEITYDFPGMYTSIFDFSDGGNEWLISFPESSVYFGLHQLVSSLNILKFLWHQYVQPLVFMPASMWIFSVMCLLIDSWILTLSDLY
ncbi:putative F-box/kelch-repeat protein At5g24040 [Mangifera indica]|uniref:putative F-box/kelch-repeat protein At5g24040 n=1 Tax=Mangifera indica TaxID=29780 RepID=UPI001CFB3EE5|nr:putative F-box/kelch-repeat protein At5g24040 [Mangifera indica]